MIIGLLFESFSTFDNIPSRSTPSQYSSDQNIMLYAGNYSITCDGAQGGASSNSGMGGRGTKILSTLTLNFRTNITLRVGKKGKDSADDNGGGYYDGGNAFPAFKYSNVAIYAGAGGGSSSIWIKDMPILVAAGGSGGLYHSTGAPGGDFINNFNCTSENCTSTERIKGYTDCPAKFRPSSTRWHAYSGSGGGYQCGNVVDALPIPQPFQYARVSHGGLSFINSSYFREVRIISDNINGNEGDGLITINPINIRGCSSWTNYSYCTRCQEGFYLYNGRCCRRCPRGFYGENSSMTKLQQCKPCNQTCGSCSISPDSCTSCISPYYLMGSTCVLNCGSGNYSNPQRECKQCSQNCSQCDGKAEYCTSCASNNYFVNENHQCALCPFPCSWCKSANQCTKCQKGYYLIGSKCVPHFTKNPEPYNLIGRILRRRG